MQPAPLYIVASPRPRAGKTLLARLLMEYFLDNGRPLVGFDLNPRGPVLAGRFPKLVWPVDIGDIRGQMELFDRLVADTASPKSSTSATGRSSNSSPSSATSASLRRRGGAAWTRSCSFSPIRRSPRYIYAKLQERVTAIFQPVHNESASLMTSTEDFPPTRPECGTIRMPRLSQVVRGVVDRPSFSFNTYMAHQPGGPTEIHSWIADLYTQFRDFELRLLMGRLNSSLGWAAPASPPASRKGWLSG